MKSSIIIYVVYVIMVIPSCGSESKNKDKLELPLQAAYGYFDQLSQSEFHFEDLDHKLNTAKGKNNIEEIKSCTKEFEVLHTSCINKMEAKFPEGTLRIPFEQMQGKDTLTVKSVYLSGFSFPWNTAITICFYFTVEYELHKTDLWFVPISFKFIDREEDIIYACNLPANSSGKSKFLVNAQFTFREFKKLIINQ
jgi:hypothetical protein